MKRIDIILVTLLLTFTISCTKESVNDNIDCYEGYTGYNCDEQLTPSKITITKVINQSFPSNISDGLSSYPDIALKVYNDNNSYGPSSLYYEDAISWGSYTYYPKFAFYDAYDNIHVVLYDYDFLFGDVIDQDYIGGV
jgi:hypothetical protein